ncbi:hypothetical protein WOLCODRAFT_137238 [Wolfiporia cocos MD-104 SS10]|uniref:DUF7719 domain-containing protein n=1 Tax=Wolfiporia cocos (strain MD-104) TaxID=742152 RepID=A0A2H3JG57_WOLCO|nr:hypothetical protein WOLCODRAFT_137238 [Wolfiporia cocos MD-104 SS10]
MARNRKGQPKEPKSEASGNLELSEEEQWRIVNESGILKKMPQPPRSQDEDEGQDEVTFAEEIFDATLFIIPMSFLLLLMEILVHWQYGKRPTYEALGDRMISGVPILSLFIFYSNRYKRHRTMQFIFFLLCLAAAPRLIWIINRASWRVVMKQCPPLATICVYAVLQLDLAPVVLSFVLIGGWVWYTKMKIIL